MLSQKMNLLVWKEVFLQTFECIFLVDKLETWCFGNDAKVALMW